MIALVPRRSGAKSPSTVKVTSARPSWLTSISSTLPTVLPATRTSLPFTSWPAFTNSAVTL